MSDSGYQARRATFDLLLDFSLSPITRSPWHAQLRRKGLVDYRGDLTDDEGELFIRESPLSWFPLACSCEFLIGTLQTHAREPTLQGGWTGGGPILVEFRAGRFRRAASGRYVREGRNVHPL